MSRLPRYQEHLKTGFTAEAVSAACYRAYAERAEEAGETDLAKRWRELAAAKDRLARLQLEAAGKLREPAVALRDAVAEDRYENDVLYPRMIEDVGETHAEVFRRVIEAQKEHVGALEELRRSLTASGGGA